MNFNGFSMAPSSRSRLSRSSPIRTSIHRERYAVLDLHAPCGPPDGDRVGARRCARLLIAAPAARSAGGEEDQHRDQEAGRGRPQRFPPERRTPGRPEGERGARRPSSRAAPGGRRPPGPATVAAPAARPGRREQRQRRRRDGRRPASGSAGENEAVAAPRQSDSAEG
ncbi:MAG: hypothetical protein M0C28_03280 [Candidatus Moduliflexus flocculans]|nr:hypothetical protein [Candidatus Moduliflexus flocculans]